MALSVIGCAGHQGDHDIDNHGLTPNGLVHWNLEWQALYDAALRKGEGNLTAHGVLMAETGERTGRSPNDKFVVKIGDGNNPLTNDIWWGDINVPTTPEIYQRLSTKVRDYLSNRDELFVQDLHCGADADERLAIRVVTENAWHSAFARNMFLRPPLEEIAAHVPEFTILHAPHFHADPEIDGTNSHVFVMISFEERTVIIGGTCYAGEIKKSIFSIMNHLLPGRGHLPMHCSSNTTGDNTAVFFGLSGTGKTTLSADPNRALVGDDEHGWSAKGVFNFEGGCYAKLIDLSEEEEPAIFATTRMPGSILENIVIDGEGVPDFTDDTLTANTRGSYPIEFIENRTEDSMAGHPQNVVFLTCDAFGVLPPISRLNPAQAAYHFISGYTAKVAGTEVGVKEPQATFSACFGAPFMPRHPSVYADLLAAKIAEHGARCWLLNTGWVSGGYGKSKRIRIKWTRALLNAALDGSLNDAEFVVDSRFGFEVPQTCEGVPEEILNPRDTWSDGAAYDSAADHLANMFGENFIQFEEGTSQEVLDAAPKPLS
ncbi:MAG: phosphoenolpyruvate carboxykinase (ATP) [Candidatus Poseidoniales archaeon]|nr:phosphoenolpyruvate carboxykinase (ATP) [Candidatus Poseidoniales archaeon]